MDKSSPFLCKFVNESYELTVKNSSDIREFLTHKKVLSTNSFTKDQVLLITRSNDFEVDLIGISLMKEGMDYIRLNVDEIPNSIRISCNISNEVEGKLVFSTRGFLLDPSKISVALLRYAEITSLDLGISNFMYLYSLQQWQNILHSLLNELKCNWVNNPSAISDCDDRYRQLSIAKKLGFNIPSTIITNDPKMATKFYNLHNGKVIIKVLHHHRVDFQNKAFSIFTRRVSDSDLKNFESLIAAPCLLQEEIKKDHELRVTVVGNSVFAARLDLPNDLIVDIHSYGMSEVTKKAITLSPEFEEKCKMLIRTLKLEFGALDFVVDHNGRTFFLEVNATGDWYWIERDTGLPITESVIKMILNKRNG